MKWFRERSLLDESFKAGITLKGIDGLLEIAGGLLIALASRAQMDRLIAGVTEYSLSRDPHDFIAQHLLSASQYMTREGRVFASVYLLSHGLAKVILVAALWLNRLWAYPMMIALLALFVAYQVYRMSLSYSWWLMALTLFDLLVIWLTWAEYRKQKRHFARRGPQEAAQK